MVSDMTEQTDAQLVQQARQGDSQALAQLFQRYWPAARATAYGVLGQLHLVEDAAAEAMGVALQGLNGLKEADKFGAWLHTIVVRTARQMLSNTVRQRRVEQAKQPPEDLHTVPDQLEQRELVCLLHEAVEQLPDLQREAVTLYYFEGYTVEQAANFVDVPVGTLKRRLHEGRQDLQGVIQQMKSGRKPMDAHRETVLKQLEQLLNPDLDVDRKQVQLVIQQAMKLRPYPRELMTKIAKQYFAKQYGTPESQAQAAMVMKKMMKVLRESSPRLNDPSHALCQVAQAIQAALSTFELVDLWGPEEQTDDHIQQMLKSLSGQGDMVSHLASTDLSLFLYRTRTIFFQDDQGGWYTMRELAQLDETPPDLWQRAGLSDAFVLHWNVTEALDLQTLEQCLRDLAKAVIPKRPFTLQPYDSPRYRSALRMQFNDSTLPAAIGGILMANQDDENERQRASVMLCLEAWASALSGESVGLEDATPYRDAMTP